MTTKRTVKTRRFFVCERPETGLLVILGVRQKGHFARRLQKQHPGSFIVQEYMVVDEDAWDVGTISWCDHRGNPMDLERETGQLLV